MPTKEKLAIKGFLLDLIKVKYGLYPSHLSNKLLKLLIDVAKHTLPDEWPDFLSDLQSLGSVSIVLYLKSLQMMVEEFSTTKPDVVHSRKKMLQEFLAMNRSGCLQLVHGILTHNISAFAHSEEGVIGLSMQSPKKPELLFNAPQIALGASPSRSSWMDANSSGVKRNPVQENTVIKQAVILFSALIPVTPVSDPSLPLPIQALFDLSLVTNENGVLALSCVIDLSTKIQVPKGFESYSLFLGTHVMKLLEACSQKETESSYVSRH